MSDPAKTSIWSERVRRPAGRAYFYRADGFVCVSFASSNENEYAVETGDFVGLQPYLGTGSVTARRGSTGFVSVLTSGTPDITAWYDQLWIDTVSGFAELTDDETDEDTYTNVVAGFSEFTSTESTDRLDLVAVLKGETFADNYEGATT